MEYERQAFYLRRKSDRDRLQYAMHYAPWTGFYRSLAKKLPVQVSSEDFFASYNYDGVSNNVCFTRQRERGGVSSARGSCSV